MSKTVELFARAQESQEKFDYFVCGISGALFAYLGPLYTPRKLAFDASLFEPLALSCFIVSFYMGLKRIEHTTEAKRLNFHHFQACDRASQASTQAEQLDAVA